MIGRGSRCSVISGTLLSPRSGVPPEDAGSGSFWEYLRGLTTTAHTNGALRAEERRRSAAADFEDTPTAHLRARLTARRGSAAGRRVQGDSSFIRARRCSAQARPSGISDTYGRGCRSRWPIVVAAMRACQLINVLTVVVSRRASISDRHLAVCIDIAGLSGAFTHAVALSSSVLRGPFQPSVQPTPEGGTAPVGL